MTEKVKTKAKYGITIEKIKQIKGLVPQNPKKIIIITKMEMNKELIGELIKMKVEMMDNNNKRKILSRVRSRVILIY